MTAHGSFETFRLSRGVSRDHTLRECHRRGPAKLGEQLLISFSRERRFEKGSLGSGLSF